MIPFQTDTVHRSGTWPVAALVAALAAVQLGGVAASASAVTLGNPAARVAASDTIDEEQLLVLRESLYLVTVIGNVIWQGWTQVPLPALIVGEEREFLVNAPEGVDLGEEWSTEEQFFGGRAIYSRPREYDPALRATMPVEGVPAAVMGRWEHREESPNEWAITLAREWFHVLQLHRQANQKVSALGLVDVDVPAWQIDYDFPYSDPEVGNALHLLGQSLYDFLTSAARLPQSRQRAFVAETARAALENLRAIVRLKHGDEVYRYFQFIAWKEGVARYTEVHLARRAAEKEIVDEFRPRPGFDLLRGATSYARLWQDTVRTKYWLIRNAGRPGERNRTSLYAIGHGIAELLDAVDADWKEHYFEPDVWLDDLVADALSRAAPSSLR